MDPQQQEMEQELLKRQQQEPPAQVQPQQSLSDDPAVLKALALLDAADRPTVPIRTYDNPDKFYEEVLKRYNEPRLPSNAVAATPIDKSAIYLLKKYADTSDPYMVASTLLHEQVHAMQPHNDRSETAAYKRQLDFIEKYPNRFPTAYRDNMRRMLAEVMKREQAKKQ